MTANQNREPLLLNKDSHHQTRRNCKLRLNISATNDGINLQAHDLLRHYILLPLIMSLAHPDV